MRNFEEFFYDYWVYVADNSRAYHNIVICPYSEVSVKVAKAHVVYTLLDLTASSFSAHIHAVHAISWASSLLSYRKSYESESRASTAVRIKYTVKGVDRCSVLNFDIISASHFYDVDYCCSSLLENMRKSGFTLILKMLAVSLKVPLKNISIENAPPEVSLIFSAFKYSPSSSWAPWL